MKGMDLAQILQIAFKLEGFSLDILELTTFQEIQLDGTVTDRDSFRVNLSVINGTALLVMDEMNVWMDIAEEWGFSLIYWRTEAHLHEMRLIPNDLLRLVIKQLEAVYEFGIGTFEYHQEDEDFLRFIRDMPTLVYDLHTVPERVTNNKDGEQEPFSIQLAPLEKSAMRMAQAPPKRGFSFVWKPKQNENGEITAPQQAESKFSA